jgi:hypothetical protein
MDFLWLVSKEKEEPQDILVTQESLGKLELLESQDPQDQQEQQDQQELPDQ